jgi:hypothetical protein
MLAKELVASASPSVVRDAVEPSMSVNKRVTGPSGRSGTPISIGHNATGRQRMRPTGIVLMSARLPGLGRGIRGYTFGDNLGGRCTQPERIARRLPGAQLVEFAESGHFMWAEEPDRFFMIVSSWLTDQGC